MALLTSLVAVIVVATRGGAASADGKAEVAGETKVAASEVVRLKRDTVENVTEAGKVIGVKVTDDKLAKALGLADGDVITAIAGRTIKREFDVYDAVLGLSMMDVSVVYVDVLHDKKPALRRWQLDGDLRSARRGDDALGGGRGGLGSYGGGSGGLGSLGGTGTIGSLGGSSDPYGGLGTRDPIIDTIKKIDDFHFELPRASVDKIISDPMSFSKGARVVPAMQNGVPAGIKLYAIRPSSLFAALGFNNGDTIRAVNGFELDSIDKGLEVYTKVRDAHELAIDITRRGKYELITITIK
ncbi:MAG TPA: hypothetical protein VFQ53_15710 [Kofleriaceae bacterium]|nr:hypothetical protein [Kofleriaceae bacterium]